MHQQWRYSICWSSMHILKFDLFTRLILNLGSMFQNGLFSPWPVKYVKKGLCHHLVNEEYDVADRNNKIKHKYWHYPIILFLLLVFQFYYIILFHLLVDGRNLFDVQVPHSGKIWVLFLVEYLGWILLNDILLQLKISSHTGWFICTGVV